MKTFKEWLEARRPGGHALWDSDSDLQKGGLSVKDRTDSPDSPDEESDSPEEFGTHERSKRVKCGRCGKRKMPGTACKSCGY
jgi:hypothetical protein